MEINEAVDVLQKNIEDSKKHTEDKVLLIQQTNSWELLLTETYDLKETLTKRLMKP